jgi:pimeloyl-ACP methyl ester carboxylesterase
MTTYGLVHGASHGAWCWERFIPFLEERGHRAVAPDLPCDDPDAGIADYAAVVAAAVGDEEDVVLVGHSLGSLVVPVVAARRPVRGLVFLCSVPTGPGPAIDAELLDMVTPEYAAADRTLDEFGRELLSPAAARLVWYDDCTPDDADWAVARLRPQSRRPLVEPSPLEAWPDAALAVVLARDDRCVRMAWAVPAARARLGGRDPVLLDGGHSPFLSRPAELGAVLEGVVAAWEPSDGRPG